MEPNKDAGNLSPKASALLLVPVPDETLRPQFLSALVALAHHILASTSAIKYLT